MDASAEETRRITRALWLLEATWPNIEMMLHRLWGHRVERQYSNTEREELSVLRELLARRREMDHG